MLYLLLIVTLVFTLFNYKLVKKDLLHPSFIFSFMFFIYTFMCVINKKHFAITLHLPTVLVITIGLGIFSFFTVRDNKTTSSTIIETDSTLSKISIPNAIVFTLIVIQFITIFSFIIYLTDISLSYDKASRSLSEMISLFDTMTKFWIPTFEKLNVGVPLLYRIGNPISTAGSYIVLYVMVHNYVIDRKINVLHVISVLLLCVLIILNGSRSPLFRVITMAFVIYYILSYKAGKIKIDNRKNLIIVLGLGIGVVLLFIIMLFAMGRSDKIGNLGSYLFIYAGAPIVNLDTWIMNNTPRLFGGYASIIGEQTFRTLYTYIAKILHMPQLVHGTIDAFTYSSNGIEIGNVYTMYYKYIYDFGYIGVIILTAIIAWYYIGTYKKIQNSKIIGRFSLRLFAYAYLFNDLIMSTFSARFYETVFDAPFIKLMIIVIFVKVFYFDFEKVKVWANKPICIEKV